MPVTATRAVFRDLASLRARLRLLASAPSRGASHGRVVHSRHASCRVVGSERTVRDIYGHCKPGSCARVAKGTPVSLPRRHTGTCGRTHSRNWHSKPKKPKLLPRLLLFSFIIHLTDLPSPDYPRTNPNRNLHPRPFYVRSSQFRCSVRVRGGRLERTTG